MSLVNLDTAIRLPAPDVEALIQGRAIAAIVWRSLDPGEKFALYPADIPTQLPSDEKLYRSNFLPIAKTALDRVSSETVIIQAWAKCELCQMLDESEPLETLSQLTIWTVEGFRRILSQRPYILLAYLRVYKLPQLLEIPVYPKGNFVPLSRFLSVTEASPILSDRVFSQRCSQLENRLPPEHPELEDLQAIIAQYSAINPAVRGLDKQIKTFLGWSDETFIKPSNLDLAWIDTVAALGNRSKELDEGKSNYQAGTDFENVVRKSLEFLGFTVDYFHRGGAGGVDVFCSQPYPLICECKAGKKIPNTTAVQLLNLGTLRLSNKERFQVAAKLIIGPGEPTLQLNEAATIQGMSIINPETLEKLVKLQALFPNAIDLLKLKQCLKPGKSDREVETYIEQVEQEIKLRSQVIQILKKYLENSGFARASVDSLSGAYSISNPPQPLSPKDLHEILVELSSPLTGYVGRIKGEDWRRDRFYFLRELPVE